jgi:hypothetical protein
LHSPLRKKPIEPRITKTVKKADLFGLKKTVCMIPNTLKKDKPISPFRVKAEDRKNQPLKLSVVC